MNLEFANYPIRTLRTLRAEECYRDLSHQLKERAVTEEIHYFPSPGNWGDSLINAGASEFFAEYGIDVLPFGRDHIKSVDVRAARRSLAIVGGGGGWNRNWDSTITFTEEVSRLYRSVVVLPSSFDPELLQEPLRPNVLLASRARGRSLRAADIFCHDMAFFLRGYGSEGPKMGHPLIALRRDKERNARSVNPDRNWDLSLLGNAFTSHTGLLDIVSRFGLIYTDRLHIAILGGMLGSKVQLLDGNYGKNLGVFDSSMKENYPSVQFGQWESVEWDKLFGATPIGEPGYFASDVINN